MALATTAPAQVSPRSVVAARRSQIEIRIARRFVKAAPLRLLASALPLDQPRFPQRVYDRLPACQLMRRGLLSPRRSHPAPASARYTCGGREAWRPAISISLYPVMAPPRFDFGKDGNDCQAAGEYCSPSRAFVAIGMLSTASRSHQAFNGNDLGIGLGKAARFRSQQTFRRAPA